MTTTDQGVPVYAQGGRLLHYVKQDPETGQLTIVPTDDSLRIAALEQQLEECNGRHCADPDCEENEPSHTQTIEVLRQRISDLNRGNALLQQQAQHRYQTGHAGFDELLAFLEARDITQAKARIEGLRRRGDATYIINTNADVAYLESIQEKVATAFDGVTQAHETFMAAVDLAKERKNARD